SGPKPGATAKCRQQSPRSVAASTRSVQCSQKGAFAEIAKRAEATPFSAGHGANSGLAFAAEQVVIFIKISLHKFCPANHFAIDEVTYGPAQSLGGGQFPPLQNSLTDSQRIEVIFL